ncbi:pentatricopeptide repeat protein-like protein [Plenodomus tracheiphilus IPT5]|uniref:Pentatricopeptide repeat protein-like protein n=1 Tax=Plenodomus tracheiphilus IPT5 TaxID=1408161 RepID=A0A6A7BEH6_9PLEO|nr:pentatricopeptide repeat protein-like protein [Plenodomus tracheiphilus IPT5]
MLSCRACFRRHVQALDVPTAHVLRPRSHVRSIPAHHGARLLSTHQGVPSHVDDPDDGPRPRQDRWKRSGVAANVKKREDAALRNSNPNSNLNLRPTRDETPNLARLGHRDPRIPETDWNRRKRELRYLQDPLELATFVSNELRKDRVEEMLQLVIMASHSMECVVSWNHIVDHYLTKGRVTDAIKVYNDMKKRAQFPDAYTYTILLRGLSENAHLSGVLSKALSIYHSLSAPNSRVAPSIIHTNAALRVCARALDMDALWGIAGKIPESGPAAANARTYLTIINALRQSLLLNGPKGETAEQAASRKDRGIVEARRMWEGIVGRWRSADLIIDEELICAMGRLLLAGSRPRDWDDVLSLVEQTMDVPRFVPRLGTEERQLAGLPRLRAPNVPAQHRFDDDHLSPDSKGMRGDEFLALKPQGMSSMVPNALSYVRPGNNTLSLVQEVCLKTVASKASQDYWDALTDPGTYNVVPDLVSLHMRLRNIRQARASAQAVQLLQEQMIDKGIMPRPATYRIAMSSCVRDKNNHNSMKHATQILNTMLRLQEDVDAKAVTMFAELAVSFPLAKGSDLVDALTMLNPIVRNLRLQLSVGGQMRGNQGVGATYLKGNARQDAINALRRIHGVYDRLLYSNLIEEGQKASFKVEKAKLSSFIRRVMFKDGGDQSPAAKAVSEQELEPEEVDQHSYPKDTEDVVEKKTERDTRKVSERPRPLKYGWPNKPTRRTEREEAR